MLPEDLEGRDGAGWEGDFEGEGICVTHTADSCSTGKTNTVEQLYSKK